MSDLIIRRMRLEDCTQVHGIEEMVFPTPWSLRDFEKEMTVNRCARYLVAEEDGKIVGFAGAWMILDESHMTNIAVLPEYRGRGIGRRLMESLMQYASNLGVSYMTLEVRAGNEKAQALYASLGFIRVSVRKKYYEDNGEDGFLMVADRLPPPEDDFEEDETVREVT